MKKFTFSVCLGLISSVAWAQSNNSQEAFWGGALSLTVMERQAVLARQAGIQNDEVTLRQMGGGNQAYYQNAGGSQTNRVTMVQDGDGNRLNLSLNGNQNEYLLEQRGNSNDMQLNGMRGDNVNLSVRQSGNGNGLTLTDNALEAVGGMVGPIKIEQTGGARVTVTSSYFTRQ